MGLANYIASATASGSGGITHSVSNPGNNNFAWLNASHIESGCPLRDKPWVPLQAR